MKAVMETRNAGICLQIHGFALTSGDIKVVPQSESTLWSKVK